MTQGIVLSIYGGLNGEKRPIPESFFTFMQSSKIPKDSKLNNRKKIVLGRSKPSSRSVFRGRLIEYENASEIEVMNHVELEPETKDLDVHHSLFIKDLSFVVFPKDFTLVLETSKGFNIIEDYFNQLLPDFFQPYPEAKNVLDKIYIEHKVTYTEPRQYLLSNKKHLKTITYQIAAVNYNDSSDCLLSGISPQSDVLLSITLHAQKRGGTLPELLPEEFAGIIDAVGGDGKFKTIRTKKIDGTIKTLQESKISFPVTKKQISQKLDLLEEHGLEFIEEHESIIKNVELD